MTLPLDSRRKKVRLTSCQSENEMLTEMNRTRQVFRKLAGSNDGQEVSADEEDLME